jgi:hypothetical protein
MMLLEEKSKTKVEAHIVVTLGFNLIAIYLSHLITLEIWRSLTGH